MNSKVRTRGGVTTSLIGMTTSVVSVVSLFTLVTGCASVTAPGIEPKATNDLPNPYRSERPWGHLPGDRGWGALSAVGIDNDGRSVWVADRCGPNPRTPPGASATFYDSCANSSEAPIHAFDASGQLLHSFGAGLFVFPHKIYMDRAGNVWVADNRGPNERELKENPASAGRGNAVYKFSPHGQLLMTLGTPGKPGNPPRSLTQPNSIVETPEGDILIAEGHTGQAPDAPPDTVARISRFKADGTYVASFGKLGSGPGEFKTPHDIAIDARGRLLVADRGNMRIQILTTQGVFIAEMKQFSRPSAIALRGDTLYVADSESNGVAPHPGWKRGIRIGSYASGIVQYRIPDVDELPGGTSAAEGIAVDADGVVYGAEVGTRRLARHTPPAP